jgi:8-oxo-dGTP pyrophosphatase MutT (NUDIX family)
MFKRGRPSLINRLAHIGETLMQALARELWEEGHIEMTAPPLLHGVFFHPIYSRRDHVTIYVVRSFRQTSKPEPNREIAAHGFFPADALPADTNTGTRARIAEVLNGKPPPERW